MDMDEWNKESMFELLALYEKYPAIWDPSNANYKNENIVAGSWLSIQKDLSVNFKIKTLQKKIDLLMSSYRTLKREVEASMTSSAGNVDIYRPTWFAYDTMDKFLGKIVGTVNKTINTEEVKGNSVDGFEDNKTRMPQDAKRSRPTESSAHQASPPGVCPSTSTGKTNLKRKAVSCASEIHIQQNVKQEPSDALEVLVQRPAQKQENPKECVLYMQLLASRLMTLSIKNRKMLMNRIDNLVFQAEMAEMENQSIIS